MKFTNHAIAGQHDLPAVREQRIEGVRQLVERRPFADEKLNVVDHQEVSAATLLPETRQPRSAQRFDEARDELLGRKIHSPLARMRVPVLGANRTQQMGFARAARTDDIGVLGGVEGEGYAVLALAVAVWLVSAEEYWGRAHGLDSSE